MFVTIRFSRRRFRHVTVKLEIEKAHVNTHPPGLPFVIQL